MSTDRDRLLSRRKLLGYGGMAGAVGLAASLPGEPVWLDAKEAAQLQIVFTTRLFRREDQLCLWLDCVNLKLAKAGEAGPEPVNTARLVRVLPRDPETYLIVRCGPQSLGERAYLETDVDGEGGDESAELTAPTTAAVAGESRLAFKVPPSVLSIPYDLASLLTWHRYAQSVVPHAAKTVTQELSPVAPGPTQTWIEVPRRIVLSPHEEAGWAHTVSLPNPTPAPGERVELWHTRLGVRTPTGVDERNTDDRTVRAVWTPNFNKLVPPDPSIDDPPPVGRTVLTPRDRYEVVRLSSDYSIHEVATGEPKVYQPLPLRVDRLMLSSLGAWLQAHGRWPAPVAAADIGQSLVTQSWTHRASMGRDHYVRVVTVGFFLPTRQPASLVEVTERKFGTFPVRIGDPRAGKPAAFLRKRMFLVPAPGWFEYKPDDQHIPHGGREFPFRWIRITTPVTPSLAAPYGDDPVLATGVPVNPTGDPLQPGVLCHRKQAFWPMVPVPGGGVVDVPFAMEAIDAEDRVCRLSLPLIFVSANLTNIVDTTQKLVAYYNRPDVAARRTAAMGGQRVALATFPDAKGDAAYPVSTVTFGAAEPAAPNAPFDPKTEPRFFPKLAKAEVHLDALDRVRGSSAATAHAVTLHDAWLNTPGNAARLFAALVDPIDVIFTPDSTGGVINPNLRITGLSARTGPIGGDLSGPDAPPSFTPATFFAGASPKILGTLALTDVLADSPFASPGKAPRLISTEVPGGVESSLTWRPDLKDGGSFRRRAGAAMVITAKTVTRHDGGAAVSEISGEITNFDLAAIHPNTLATVMFRRLRFTSRNGKKPEVDADLIGVSFSGVLAFVNALQNYLKSISGGGYVDATKNGITIGESVALPNVPAGAFLLENISLTSEVSIPFTDEQARVRFSFASREKPFHLTVAMFGGGGFCGVTFGLKDFELFEVLLEFGAKLSLDIGVASGSVSVMGGVYLAIGSGGGELTGFVRINGELDIIELISMNIEFYLGLTYEFGDVKEVWGEASVTVEIDVLMFSGSVKLGPVRKRFAGGGGSAPNGLTARAISAAGGSPTFKDLMSQPDWQGYCGLFAPAAFG